MQEFTPLEYLHIDIANQYGLSKENWQDRLDWVTRHRLTLEEQTCDADKKILYAKAVHTLDQVHAGKPTGFIMGLDATASGLQIMACLSGCYKTAKNTNLKFNGQIQDIYGNIAKRMNKFDIDYVEREVIKYPIMTTFYGSKAQPRDLFGKNTPELKAFYKSLKKKLPGALDVLAITQDFWNPDTLVHSWTLPDGHRAVVKVMEPVDKRIEVDELDHTTFTHRAYINMPSPSGLSLCANIIHSIDGWIVREMIRRANIAGYQLVAIHDSFWCSPKYMNQTRRFYINILAELADSDLLAEILSEISGERIVLDKDNDDLSDYILEAEYPLS